MSRSIHPLMVVSYCLLLLQSCQSFTLHHHITNSPSLASSPVHRQNHNVISTHNPRHSPTSNPTRSTTIVYSEWSDFAALDDDDDFDTLADEDFPKKSIGFADENDPQEVKAEIGMGLEAPEVDWHGEPIFLPQGSALPLTEENVQAVLAACRVEIGTMFGYTAENRGVGITGGVDFVEMDGPIVVLSLKGRYWHQRTTVLDRVGSYIIGRIPEIVDVTVHDEWELTDEANDLAA